jgi:hypothetical protein
MTKKIALLAMTLAFVWAGCVVSSVYPYYTDKDVTFDAKLVGEWSQNNETKEFWKFAKDGDNRYAVQFTDSDKVTTDLEGRLFQLNGQRYLDLLGKDQKLSTIPVHALIKVLLTDSELTLTTINYDWMDELLKKSPAALRHHRIRAGDGPDDYRLILTADTAELQNFVIKNQATEAAWTKSDPMKRRGNSGK